MEEWSNEMTILFWFVVSQIVRVAVDQIPFFKEAE